MNDAVHPDEVERLMVALWGPGAASSAAGHAESCDACAEDVDFHRRLREAMQRLAAAEVPPRAMAPALAAAEPPVPQPDAGWIQAVALPLCAGVRSAAAAEMQFVCDVPGLRVNVVLHPAGRAGRFALSGQALRDDSTAAEGAGVTLYVDRVAAAVATTDSFGEFSFGAHAGSRFGLGLVTAEERALVEILPGAGAS